MFFHLSAIIVSTSLLLLVWFNSMFVDEDEETTDHIFHRSVQQWL